MTKKTIIPLEHRVKMRGDYPHLYVTKHARVGKNMHLLHSICVEQYSSHQPPYTAWTLNEIRETYEFPNRPAARWIACPVCGCPHGVGHFAWASLRCNECGFYSKYISGFFDRKCSTKRYFGCTYLSEFRFSGCSLCVRVDNIRSNIKSNKCSHVGCTRWITN